MSGRIDRHFATKVSPGSHRDLSRCAQAEGVRKPATTCFWIAPFALYSLDACAWGLYTHVYFAQLLLWAVPLADPRFRRAIRRFPELLLGGSCLPDISLFSGWVRSNALTTTHQWATAHRMLNNAGNDSDAAIATGYCCHLLADIVAHNHFVPAHETLWLNPSHLFVHATSEWAMDAHLADELYARPHRLLHDQLPVFAEFASRQFGVSHAHSRQALHCLAHGERLLRNSGLHHVAYRGARAADSAAMRRFDFYAAETALRLEQMNRLIAGDAPAWTPEVDRSAVTPVSSMVTGPGKNALPRDFFISAR